MTKKYLNYCEFYGVDKILHPDQADPVNKEEDKDVEMKDATKEP